MANTIQMTPPANAKTLEKQSGHGSPPESITLKARDGKRLELTSSKLDHWFASLQEKNQDAHKNKPSNEKFHEKLLGQYGLKTSADVIMFLKSKAGEAVLKAINEELAEIASLKEQQFIEDRDHQTRHYRMMAWLFLGLIYKRKARAQHLNEVIQAQIDKTLHKKDTVNGTDTSKTTRHDNLTGQLDSYSQSITALDMSLQFKLAEKKLVDEELLLLQQQWAAIVSRHAIFEERLDELEQFSANLAAASVEPEEHQLMINREIAQVYTRLSTLDSQINEHITHSLNDEASKLMHNHSAHLLHAEGLQDMLSVARGEKKLYTADGIETRSLHEANFILALNQKIAKDGAGKCYLIGANDNLNEMDEEKKSKALRKFDKMQTEILTVPKLVQHQCKLEKDLHSQREQQAQMRGKDLQDGINLLANQLRLVQSAKASIVAELEKPAPNLSRAEGMRSAIPKISNNDNAFPYGTFGQDATLQSMRQTLNAMQRNPNQNQLNAFAGGMATLFGKTGQEIPEFVKKDMNRIKPGQPVPLRIMMNLNAQLYKLEFASIKLKMEPKVAPPTAPTPFGSWPPKPGGF